MSQSVIAQSSGLSKNEFLSSLEQNLPVWIEETIVPGAAIAIIDNGELIFQKGFGFADVKNKAIVELETGFNIASISKILTAWGVMKLVEEGKIELDSPAEKYLTRWHLPDSEFNENEVTIRRLLSHTAGLSLHGYGGWALQDTLPTLEESLSGKTNGAGDVKIIIEPGTKWKYSGGGYTLPQLIIEEVTGKDFADYMQSEILIPLGMKNSSFKIDQKIIQKSSLAHDGDGEEVPLEVFTAKAAAGMHTTIEDLTIFALAHFIEGKDKNVVLKSSTLDLMTTPQPGTGGEYGLGYVIDPIWKTKSILIGHTGANTGWHSTFQLMRETGDAFIMLTNASSGVWLYRQASCHYLNWKLNISVLCKKSLDAALRQTLKAKGIEATLAKYKEIKASDPDIYLFHPMILDNLGSELLKKNKIEGAIGILKLNAEEYPEIWKVYDSLGEVYLKSGNKELAIVNYKKALELNPQNKNVQDILKNLTD